jgi:hypothetical protein
VNEATLREHLDDDGLLDLSELDLDDDAVSGWASFSWLARVTSLDLDDNDLTDAGLERLARCEPLTGLEGLDLTWNCLGERVGSILAAARWRELRELWLNQNPLGDACVEALAGAPSLASVERLGLAWTNVGERGLLAVFGSRHPARLRELDLRGAPVGHSAVEALVAASALGALEELDVSDNALGPDALGDAEVERILRSPRLPALRRLVLLPPRIWGSASEVDVVNWRRRLA